MTQDSVVQTANPTSPASAGQADDPGHALSHVDLAIRFVERWRLLILGPLGAGLMGIVIMYIVPPAFTASTTFMPLPQSWSEGTSALASPHLLAHLGYRLDGKAMAHNTAEQHGALMPSVTVADRPVDQFRLVGAYEAKSRVGLSLEDSDPPYVLPLPNTVGALGSVINTANCRYEPGQSLGNCQRLAKESTEGANERSARLVGTDRPVLASRQSNRWFGHGGAIQGLTAWPGDVAFVAEEIVEPSFVQETNAWAQGLSSDALFEPVVRWATRAVA